MGHFCRVYFGIWQNVEPTLKNLVCFWVNFHCSKRPDIEQIILSSGHTELVATLTDAAIFSGQSYKQFTIVIYDSD